MDTSEAAFEANVELDGQALLEQQRRKGHGNATQATAIAKGGLNLNVDDTEDQSVEEGESSPLLRRSREEDGGSQDGSDDGSRDDQETASVNAYDFSHLPWYRRPSIFWVLFPFFLMACAFGGIITPKMNLILELVCREYISERTRMDPSFTMLPVDFNDGANSQCRIPAVSSRVAQFNLWGNLIAGLLSALMSPLLGEWSDRYGRKPILVITSIGTICGEIVTICAASYPEVFPVHLMLLSYAFDGLTGSFVVAMAIANSYATDCTPPERRNVVFGYFHSCLFMGIALGPIVAGYIVKETGRIVVIFYILTAVHLWFVTFVGLFVPESLSPERKRLAQEKHRKLVQAHGPGYRYRHFLRPFDILGALKVLRPTGPGTSAALRRNLAVIAAVDTICFGVAMGSLSVLIIYMNYQFGWGSFESGRFLTIVNSCRVFALLVIMPILTRLVRGKPSTEQQKPGSVRKNQGADTFDLTIIRLAIFIDSLGYLGYTLARSGPIFTLSGAVAAFGGIGSPTLQAVLTKHVPAEQTGKLLGASGMLHALARVVAPTVFSAIYSATVGKFTQTVFVCLAATFGVAWLGSWGIRPGLYLDEEKAAQGLEESIASLPSQPAASSQGRVPIVDSVIESARSVSSRIMKRPRREESEETLS